MGHINDRLFSIIEVHSKCDSKITVGIQELFHNPQDLEVINAIQEIGNDVLDLDVNQSMYFQPNRDDDSSKGIIKRIR
jgi:hypothetical protein